MHRSVFIFLSWPQYHHHPHHHHHHRHLHQQHLQFKHVLCPYDCRDCFHVYFQHISHQLERGEEAHFGLKIRGAQPHRPAPTSSPSPRSATESLFTDVTISAI